MIISSFYSDNSLCFMNLWMLFMCHTCCSWVTCCLLQETFETDVTLTSLEPYTLYTVQVKANNFYSDSPTTLSPRNVEYFMTKPGSQYTYLTFYQSRSKRWSCSDLFSLARTDPSKTITPCLFLSRTVGRDLRWGKDDDDDEDALSLTMVTHTAILVSLPNTWHLYGCGLN